MTVCACSAVEVGAAPGTEKSGEAAKGGVEEALAQVRDALDGRRLIWFGTRGEDGEALLRLPELHASFAITAPLRSARLPQHSNVTLEAIARVRPDLDCHDIDLDRGEPARELRRRLLHAVSARCAIVTYRPSRLVSTMAFSMSETMLQAGLFRDRQAAFEHKPWVETSLKQGGVRTLGWRYVAEEHRSRLRRMAAAGPLVLRANRASGGVGVVRLDPDASAKDNWPLDDEGFVGAAHFLADAVPLNFSGCVYGNGVVHLHPPSLQLIGVPACTGRPFGYCGNDFAAASRLDEAILSQLDALGQKVGSWLHSERYFGAFGVDAMLEDGQIFFTEINPRFQGSSALSAEIASELDMPDLLLEHLAASLGLDPPGGGTSISEWAARQKKTSHVVVHNVSSSTVVRRPDAKLPTLGKATRLTQVLPLGVSALPGATLFRLVLPRRVTETGFEVDAETAALVERVRACFGLEARARGTSS